MYIFFIYPTPVFGGGVKDAACEVFHPHALAQILVIEVYIAPILCFLGVGVLQLQDHMRIEMPLLAHPAELVKTFCEALVTGSALTFVFKPRNIMIYCFHIRMFFNC